MSRTFDYLSAAAGPISLSRAGGGLVAYSIESFQSPLLDFSVAVFGIEILPAKPKHVALLVGAPVFIFESSRGTQTSTATVNLGSDATHDDFANINTPGNVLVNAITVYPCTIAYGGLSTPGNPTRLTPNATVFLDVAVPAAGTGNFSLKGRLSFTAAWLPVGG